MSENSTNELDQLVKAKNLAMDNNPREMLPKVLETASTMTVIAINSNSSDIKAIRLARFFASTFVDIMNSKEISKTEKPFIASQYLETLWLTCSRIVDPIAYKYTILSLTISYPLLLDLVAKTSNDKLWTLLTRFKDKIIKNWRLNQSNKLKPEISDDLNDDSKNIGCKLATVKFLSQIVITQTVINDNSPNNSYPISITSVPNNHPVISNKPKLETEAKNCLDLLLNYLIEEPMMISSAFIGVLNCLSFIMKARSQTTIRILSALLRFNVDGKYQLDDKSAVNYKLSKRFVERCYKNFVNFGIKNQLIKNGSQSNSMNQMYSKLSKIAQTLHVIGEETKSKGILNFTASETENKINKNEKEKIISYRLKQQRKLDGTNSSSTSTSSATGTPSFTAITEDIDKKTITVQQTSQPASDISLEHLTSLQKYAFSKNSATGFTNSSPIATGDSYSAIYSLMNMQNSNQNLSNLSQDNLVKLSTEAIMRCDTTKLISALSIVASRYTDLMTNKRKREDDETEIKEEHENKKVKTESDSEDENEVQEDIDVTKPMFEPKPMDQETKINLTKRIINKIIEVKDSNIEPSLTVPTDGMNNTLNMIKLVDWKNSESWYHILIRLATRGTAANNEISNIIREQLLSFVLDDFDNKAAIMVEWMNEEWYSFKLKITNEDSYKTWSIRLLNELIPFLENKHRRIFIRLMSELPSLSSDHVSIMKPILMDPSRSSLGFQALKFLIMFRAPVKPMIKDLLDTVMQEDSSLEEQCKSLLDKYYK
ncbi:hypothetical protein KAFR_0K00460 [Kazachstania africana CBS 2517]|uniref:Symplekin/Pta1 N-terminal domain-containing protein n=1 Tax=Kazachstania africana (strain ATCC 22294 / BCRC 22015 / CBS 2517 / CECT 1963 / NBRC 1671 / NRRL Y-8276) TaxID=1071382 RepID=H2B1A1_KAZAF|nr:hypothetical protein KAFR_0K00460 [Kazachstania africana CBS 2517]CCF60401.1 hypothetical protein KAFR_0K00460 [Kazachstania africana CBS 2517]